ncbi:MAG TPA: anti-sigma factor antagonist [Ruminococcaceae bacterium]|mgnify:CR=1 FL=1|nr:anti-sigma factor antagonist [Oscillospiraceae bacterium]
MTINKIPDGTTLNLEIVGRLDTVTAPQLEEELKSISEDVKKLVLDFAQLEYISSAGLRVLLKTQKTMMKKGQMVIRNANDSIKEVFELTGFMDFLTLE